MQGSYALYRCAVLSTSTSSLSDILDRDSPIQILHLGVEMEGRVAADGLEVDNAQYCGWRKNHLNEKVRTIPPTQETLSHTFQYLIEQGYHEAIITTLGSRLSDTAEVIRKIAREYKELKIYVVDTGMWCMPEGYFALEALRLLREGKRPPEIITYLERLKPRCNIFFGIPSTRPLVVNGTVGLAGSENGIALYRQRVDARRFGIGHRRNDGRGDSLGYAGHARQRQRRFRSGRTLFRQPRVLPSFRQPFPQPNRFAPGRRRARVAGGGGTCRFRLHRHRHGGTD